uniref:hypothetical protein n=1 Tax=Streptobacillus moniliformis TaxID=34105 RepID=UPI000B1B7882
MKLEGRFLKDLEDYKKILNGYNDKENKKRICGEQALKPNLYENICFDIYSLNRKTLDYYFKFSE